MATGSSSMILERAPALVYTRVAGTGLQGDPRGSSPESTCKARVGHLELRNRDLSSGQENPLLSPGHVETWTIDCAVVPGTSKLLKEVCEPLVA